MNRPKIVIGDSLSILRQLPDQKIHCCVTSPPYFGLRDYGHEGQIGLEQTPDEYVVKLVEVFREVRRVLRDDGTLWLNLGDSYARDEKKGPHKPGQSGGKNAYLYDIGGGRASACVNLKSEAQGSSDGKVGRADRAPVLTGAVGLKQKDLIGIPWMVAFALRADGWYLRQDIIWHKPNPMPESVRDRCTKAHEYIFLLSKSPRYYYNHEVVKEDALSGPAGTVKKDQQRKMNSTPLYQPNRNGASQEPVKQGAMGIPDDGKKNRRSVWTVSPKPYKEAHFATFPPDLIEPCVLAGCPEGGVVLDPFGGSGTTGEVAQKHSRRSILLELNPEYAALAVKRTGGIII